MELTSVIAILVLGAIALWLLRENKKTVSAERRLKRDVRKTKQDLSDITTSLKRKRLLRDSKTRS